MLLNCGVGKKLLRVPWTVRRSNQSILKEISPGCSFEGLMLKLKLQHFGTWCEELTPWKRPWCWERLKAGEEGDNRVWDGWMASLTQWTWVWVNSGSWQGQGGLVCCSSWGRKESYTMSKWTELKNLLMKVKVESEKVGLKLSIQKTKIMASGPITSWQRVETVADFIFVGSKITADGDCSHETKRCLFLGTKAMTT